MFVLEKAKILAANSQSREFINSNNEETHGLQKCQIKLKIDCDKSTVDNKDRINNEFVSNLFKIIIIRSIKK